MLWLGLPLGSPVLSASRPVMDLSPRTWLKSLRLRPADRRYALAEACLIGVVSALAALALKEGVGWMGSLRVTLTARFGAVFFLPVWGALLGFLAGLVVQYLGPETGGGGIPQVKAALAQFPISLSLRVAIAKILGTILVLGSGLTLGRRGPTVHIGAALAAQLSAWVPTSPEHRRQMIAAGAAAGLAAGFNTPIAGIFFVVEELMRDVSGLTLETAIMASFTGGVVSRLLGSADVRIPLLLSGAGLDTSFALDEIPFYVALGAISGVVGTLFGRGILRAVAFYRRSGLPLPLRIAIAGLVSGAFVALMPEFFRNNAGLREFLITGEGGWQVTAIAFVAYFLLTLLAYGSGAPGGLFAPALVLGAALGFLVGTAKVALTGSGEAFTYALAGMGAFFTGVVRVPVTAIVIVFELTADFDLVLPLMIASGIAYIVGESISTGSLYQHLLATQGIDLQDEDGADSLLASTAAVDVMRSPVETLSAHLQLDDVRKAMTQSTHRGFPVLEDGELVGIITQTDLAKLAMRPGTLPLRQFLTSRPVSVRPNAPLTEVLALLNRYQLSHLPVVEHRELLGIITRGDIIRAEVQRLGPNAIAEDPAPARADPSYLVYQTRSPALGKGRLLLPLANPDTAPLLLRIATGIARQREAELECVQVVEIPRHQSPQHTWVETQRARELMAVAEEIGRERGVPIHSQVRVAHDRAGAILETIIERQISLVLMGWRGENGRQSFFGDAIDTLIRTAPCDVVLVKPGARVEQLADKPSRWLLSVAGGPNTQRALDLLPGLSAWTQEAEFWLCQVFPPDQRAPDTTALNDATRRLRQESDREVTAIPVRAKSVSEAVLALAADECDVVVLGASREGLLQRAFHGNIPAAIARDNPGTTILIRSAD